ncbi:hypothetical protein FB451DRAFT_1194674 [Mycena latifolia]|nr:hypothetical protein FB451DRAFT_1194674 [Mycena latifolia]
MSVQLTLILVSATSKTSIVGSAPHLHLTVMSLVFLDLPTEILSRIRWCRPRHSCTSILPFLEHVDRLERFIAGAPSLKNIALQLDTPSSICLSVSGDEALRAWTRHFGGLLNCILESYPRRLFHPVLQATAGERIRAAVGFAACKTASGAIIPDPVARPAVLRDCRIPPGIWARRRAHRNSTAAQL